MWSTTTKLGGLWQCLIGNKPSMYQEVFHTLLHHLNHQHHHFYYRHHHYHKAGWVYASNTKFLPNYLLDSTEIRGHQTRTCFSPGYQTRTNKFFLPQSLTCCNSSWFPNYLSIHPFAPTYLRGGPGGSSLSNVAQTSLYQATSTSSEAFPGQLETQSLHRVLGLPRERHPQQMPKTL